MDEHTETLRDIFVNVTDQDTVTESQADDRGSLADPDERDVEDRLGAIVARMRDRYSFETDLPTDDRLQVVRAFYDGADDETIAAAIDVDADTVFRARMDLHLLDDADRDLPVDLDALRERRADDATVPTLADDLDVDASTVERALLVLDTREAIRRASHRYQSAFEDAIPDATLSHRLTESVTEDGLAEAVADSEADADL